MNLRRMLMLPGILAIVLATATSGNAVADTSDAAGTAAAVTLATPAGTAADPTSRPRPFTSPPLPINYRPPAGQNPPGLPTLGFSLNGAALAGPIRPGHYSDLGSFTPAPVWARIGFSSDGNWRANVDTYVDAARRAGMKLLIRASFPSKEYGSLAGAVNVSKYGNFVGELAAHVKAKGLGPEDVVFEYPNEINSTRITASTYAAAAKAAYPKLKAVDSRFRIIGGSENVYASNWKPWLNDLLKAGFKNAADGISFHNYDIAGDHQRYNYLRGLLVQYGWTSAMVWLTEFGTSTPPNPSGKALGGQTLDKQAERLVANLRDIGTNLPWITHAFVYADVDIPSRQVSDPFEANFGIYTNTSDGIIQPKPAVTAIRVLYWRG